MQNSASHRWVYFALTLATFFWGSGFAIARYALKTVPALEMLAAVTLLAALFEFVWIAARGGLARLRIPRSTWLPVLIIGLTGQGLLNGFTFYGLRLTTATNGALIFGFAPVLIGILAALFLREPFSGRKILGAVIGFSGVVLIVTQVSFANVKLSGMMAGNLIVLGGAIYWAGFSVATRSLARRMPPETFTFYLLVIGPAAPAAVFFVSERKLPLISVPPLMILVIAWFALTTSVVAMNVWSWALERIEASRVGSFNYLEPVFAALVAMTFLGERLTTATAVGAALIFLGVYLSTRE